MVFAMLFFTATVSGYTVAAETDSETVFYRNDFENGIIGGADDSIYISGGSITNETADGNGMLRFSVPSDVKGSAFGDVSLPMIAECDNYVIDVYIRPETIEGNSYLELFDAKDTDGNWRIGGRLKSDHTINVRNAAGSWVKAGTWEEGRLFRYSLIYDVAKGICDVYKDGEFAASINVKQLRPTIFRMDISSRENENIDVYADNLAIYSGNRLLSDEEIGRLAPKSVMDNEKLAKTALGSAWAFTCSDFYYMNGAKAAYASKDLQPVLINDEPYVSGGFLRTVLGRNDIDISKENGKVTENGILYMPASRLSEYTGKKFFFDKRGFFILSDNEFRYKDSDDFTKSFEFSDMIYRYLYFENPSAEKIKSDYVKSTQNGTHPRILVTSGDISYIKEKRSTDSTWDNTVTNLIGNADVYLSADAKFPADCADSKKQDTASEFQTCMETLTLAYLLTDDAKYAEAGMRYMKAMGSWENIAYQTSNLIIGHWAMGMAVGYDGFFNYFSKTDEGKATLAEIRAASKRLVLDDTKNAYLRKGGPRWVTIADNFQGVISGGVLSLALSMLDEASADGTYDDMIYIIENIVKSMEIAVSLYQTNGGYFEGVSYSEYMLGNLTKGIGALFNCFGSDYSLGSARGFTDAGSFFIYMQTINNRLNFHDCTPGVTSTMLPAWFAYHYGKTEAAEMTVLQNKIRNSSPDILGLLNYSRACDKYGKAEVSGMPLDMYYTETETGSFRNSFNTDIPTFAGIHGGRTGLTHDMLDVGEFTFEADGINWAMDLGSDKYTLPQYFQKDGYKIYRKRPEGENCVVINPDGSYYGQEIGASSKLLNFESNNKAAMASYDLSEIYARDVNSYTRGYYFGDDRNTLLIQDEINLKNANSEIYWFMHTPADIEIVDKKTAILTCGGKKLRAEVYCSSALKYELCSMEAEPLPSSPTVEGQNANSGIRKLAIHGTSTKGKITMAVKLIPINDFYTPQKLSMKYISQWKLPSGEISIKPSVSDVSLDMYNTFFATVQMPKNAAFAYLYIDGNPISEIEVKRGEKYTVNFSELPFLTPGEHTARVKITYDDGRTQNVYKDFESAAYTHNLFYRNDLSSPLHPVRPDRWKFTLYGQNKAFDGECFTAESTASQYVKVDFCTEKDYTERNALRGIIETSFDIKFWSLNGTFNFECKNSATEFYMHDIVIADNGKFVSGEEYETGRWYNIKLIIDTDLKTCSVYADGKPIVSNVKVTKADSNSLIRLQYIAGGEKISFKNYSVTVYKKTDSDFGTIGFSKNEIAAGTITASVTGRLNSLSEKAMLVVAVVGKESGMTVDTGVKTINYSETSDTYSVSVEVPADYEKYEVRAFLWDGRQTPVSGTARLGL